MKQKIFTNSDLTPTDAIIITSNLGIIDFSKESTYIELYFDNEEKPNRVLYAKSHILDTNQKQTTVLELPVKSSNYKIVIKALSDYDIEQIIILPKP